MATSPLRIRVAGPDDAERIALFNRRMARETENRELNSARLGEGVRALLGATTLGRYFLATAEEDGHEVVVGQLMITYEWSDWRNGAVWWIQSVYVAPEWRRRGVYRALHRHVRRRAREEDAVGLRLYVERDNAVARAAYRTLGMEESRYVLYEEIWRPA